MRSTLIGMCLLFTFTSARAGDKTEVDKLLDQAIKTAGGETKVAKLKMMTGKAKVAFSQGGIDIAVMLDTTWQEWDKVRIEADVSAGGMTMQGLLVLNGAKGWTKDSNNKRPFPKEIQSVLVNVFDAFRMPQMLPALKDKAFKLNHLGEVKVGEQSAIGISVSRPDRPDINLYFDKQTHLPLKSEVRVTDPNNQEINVEFHFSEYRDFDGLKHFSRMTVRGFPGVEPVLELTELQTRDQLDAALFNEPD